MNPATIIILLILIAVVTLIIRQLISDKKKGRSSCGCKCGCCPNSSMCHSKKDNQGNI